MVIKNSLEALALGVMSMNSLYAHCREKERLTTCKRTKEVGGAYLISDLMGIRVEGSDGASTNREHPLVSIHRDIP